MHPTQSLPKYPCFGIWTHVDFVDLNAAHSFPKEAMQIQISNFRSLCLLRSIHSWIPKGFLNPSPSLHFLFPKKESREAIAIQIPKPLLRSLHFWIPKEAIPIQIPKSLLRSLHSWIPKSFPFSPPPFSKEEIEISDPNPNIQTPSSIHPFLVS